MEVTLTDGGEENPDTAPDGNIDRGTALTVVHDPAAQGNSIGGTGLTLKRPEGRAPGAVRPMAGQRMLAYSRHRSRTGKVNAWRNKSPDFSGGQV